MFDHRTAISSALWLAAASGLGCVGRTDTAESSSVSSVAPTGPATGATVAEPLPAEEEIPSDDSAPNTPVEPTDEELGAGTVEGHEGEPDEGLDQAIGAGADEPGSPVQQPGGSDEPAGALATSARGAALYHEARRIVGFTDRPTSYYSFTTLMNESTGTRRTDCTGLMTYVLARKQVSAYKQIPISAGASHPLSADFYDYFMSRPATGNPGTDAFWRRIIHPKYLGPGDLIAYKYAKVSSSGTTGHTMIVTGFPTAGRKGELLVRVADSARSGHASDTRGTTSSGPGTGVFGIKVDSSGLAVGYYWRGGVSATLHTTRLAFGHLE